MSWTLVVCQTSDYAENPGLKHEYVFATPPESDVDRAGHLTWWTDDSTVAWNTNYVLWWTLKKDVDE